MQRKEAESDGSSSDFRALVVHLVLDGKAEQALELLARHHGVSVPRIEVGFPRHRRKKALGCYLAKNNTIYVQNSDVLKEPFVVLHEFYHHMRTSIEKKHKGTERYADDFAKEFVEAYASIRAHR